MKRFAKPGVALAALSTFACLVACQNPSATDSATSATSATASASPSSHVVPFEPSRPPAPTGDQVDEIERTYTDTVRTDVARLYQDTQTFTNTYLAGGGRDLYPRIHAQYEILQPTAERFEPTSFAIINVDRLLNERETDYQQIDDTDTHEWTGWHRVEKDIWTNSLSDRQDHADKLLENTKLFNDLVQAPEFHVDVDQICKDAVALLEEAVITKATGEEDVYSRTDLWDLKATLDGSRRAVDAVKPLIHDDKLIAQIDQRYQEAYSLLDKYREGGSGASAGSNSDSSGTSGGSTSTSGTSGGGTSTSISGAGISNYISYISYDKLTPEQRHELFDTINALRGPVTKVNEAVMVGNQKQKGDGK